MSTVVAGSHRMKVRVGQSEFEAEGDEITVNEQYRLFLDAIQGVGVNRPPSKNGRDEPTETKNRETTLDGVWARFYSLEGDSDVSLKTIPSTEDANADAIILLLYGYLQLRETDMVGSAELLSMAKKSGVRIDRVDRNIASHLQYINKGGSRRGCRYSLNNQGKNYAQQLLETEAER
jgi:hypothetical protein